MTAILAVSWLIEHGEKPSLLGGSNPRVLIASAHRPSGLKNNGGRVMFSSRDSLRLTACVCMGRNTFRGRSYWDVDALISKMVKFGERANITFHPEAFNALNHANYRSLSDATTGDDRINNR